MNTKNDTLEEVRYFPTNMAKQLNRKCLRTCLFLAAKHFSSFFSTRQATDSKEKQRISPAKRDGKRGNTP